MLARRILYLLILFAWEVVVRLPRRLLRAMIVLANVWAWHVIVFWQFIEFGIAVSANRAGFAMATLCFTFLFRRRLFFWGFRLTAGIYAVLSLILVILLFFGTPFLAGLRALQGALDNDMKVVVSAGTLFIYGVIWFAITGKFYEIFSALATIGLNSTSIRKDPDVPAQESAEEEANAILIRQYREGS